MNRTKPIWITYIILAVFTLLPSSCRVMIEPNGVVQTSHLKCIWRGFFIGPFEVLFNQHATHVGVVVITLTGVAILLGLMSAYIFKPNRTTFCLSIAGIIAWVMVGLSAAMVWK
jgi:hypothetical protein